MFESERITIGPEYRESLLASAALRDAVDAHQAAIRAFDRAGRAYNKAFANRHTDPAAYARAIDRRTAAHAKVQTALMVVRRARSRAYAA